MRDKIFAPIGVLMVIGFMGIVTIFVMEPDLWIVSILVLIVAITFIWRDLKGGGSHLEGETEASDDQLDTRPSP